MGFQQGLVTPEVREQYFGPALFDPWARWLVSGAAPRQGDTVIDLATATGAVARQLAPIVGSSGAVVGSDISETMLRFAATLPQPGGALISWEHGDITTLDFQTESFDSAYCAQGLQFIDDRVAAATEIHRVLKKGGRFVAAVFRGLEFNPSYLAINEAISEVLDIPVDSRPFSLEDAEELTKYLATGGFTEVDVRPHSMEVTFPGTELYIGTSTSAGLSGVPSVEGLTMFEKDELFEAVSTRLRRKLRMYIVGDSLRFPTAVHRVVAVK